MKRFLTFTLVFILASVPTLSQEQGKPLPDRWHGLVLNQSTPEDAIRVLGKPKKESLSQLSAGPIDHWLTKKRKEKVFKTLEYKDVSDGVQKAWLFFFDGKLASILLDLKEGTVSPNGLSTIYGVEFSPIINQVDLGLFPKDFERNQGKIYPKSYPTVYHLAAVSERSFVVAMIGNVPSFLGALGKSAGIPDKPNSYPGKVAFIQLVSRTLENRDGADVLK